MPNVCHHYEKSDRSPFTIKQKVTLPSVRVPFGVHARVFLLLQQEAQIQNYMYTDCYHVLYCNYKVASQYAPGGSCTPKLVPLVELQACLDESLV